MNNDHDAQPAATMDPTQVGPHLVLGGVPPVHGDKPRAGTRAASEDAHELPAPPTAFPDPTGFLEPGAAAPFLPASTAELLYKRSPQHDPTPKTGSPHINPIRPVLPQTSVRPESSNACYFCARRIYILERASAEGLFFHRSCFQCWRCGATLRLGDYAFNEEDGECVWRQRWGGG